MLTPCPETRPDIFQVSTLAFQLKGDPCPVQNLNVSTLYGTKSSSGFSLGFATFGRRTYQGFNLMKSLLHICRKSPYQSLATSPSILHHQSQIHLPHQQVIKSVTRKSSTVISRFCRLFTLAESGALNYDNSLADIFRMIT